MAKWIWLNQQDYPEIQTTFCTQFCDKDGYSYAVADFFRTYTFQKRVIKANITVSGDTKFRLWVNGDFAVTGPVCPGGDYGYEKPMANHYANVLCFYPESNTLDFFAQVQLSPVVQTDVSAGRGGFYLKCIVTFSDGSKTVIGTDKSWLCTKNTAYLSPNKLNFTLPPDKKSNAEEIESVWNLKKSEIPNLQEEKVLPKNHCGLVTAPHTSQTFYLDFDRIYSGYAAFTVTAEGDCRISIKTFEVPEKVLWEEELHINGSMPYRSFRLNSIGGMELTVENNSETNVSISDAGLIFTCYPVDTEGTFSCSDELLNTIYDVGKWTTKICRQTIHLDSPKHQENLGCTGDYYVESLISYYCFGDPRLTRFDILRTADLLKQRGGFMFHTSYSLIWVQMLYDYYLFSGDSAVFGQTKDALHLLMDRFFGYEEKDTGLIDTPPSFMFIDWIPVDAYNLHHPPKALGQTALCAFYYRALCLAAKISDSLLDSEHARIYSDRAKRLKASFHKAFFVPEKGLYKSGLNTPAPEALVSQFMPQNTDKVYFGKHENSLAVLYGLCPENLSAPIMETVVNSSSLTDVQPYFMHFVLDAVYKAGLFADYGLPLIRQWKKQVDECSKGMKEMWGDFPGYGYDYSHAWGATPSYQLPAKLSGLTILEPGFKKITLAPNLFGLNWAEIDIPTPFGSIHMKLKKNETPVISVPDEIEYQVI